MSFPLNKQLVDQVCTDFGLRNAKELGNASIRQLVGMVSNIEAATGEKFIHMELGSPGLPSEHIGIEAEHQALLAGCGAKYPLINGIPQVRHWGSEFVKAFIDLDIPEDCIIPTVGSMQGVYALICLISQLDNARQTMLFLDPCFPMQKQQCKVMDIDVEAFDVSEYRGQFLEQKLEEYLSKGNIISIIFSNPNNPSWMCFTETELQTIGRLCTKYNVIAIEDMAYLGMDFRTRKGQPYEPPYQPTVSRYTNNCVHLVSTSKIFSYAGQRGAMVAINPVLAYRIYPALAEKYGNTGEFVWNFIYTILACLSSGVTHSVQHAMAAMFRAACEGKIDFVENTREYARRAERIKQIMLRNGFHVVYDKDADNEPVGDGFFFTFGYKDWTGEKMLNKLIYYGVAAITLSSTGAVREGLRGCVSAISEDEYEELEHRLQLFNKDFSDK